MALSRCRHAQYAVLYAEYLESHKIALSPMTFVEPPVHSDDERPFVLARGRVLNQPERQLGIQEVRGRNLIERDDIVDVHPEDATALGISEGDEVHVMYEGGGFYAKAGLSGTQRGMLSVTSLFGQMITNIERDRSPGSDAENRRTAACRGEYRQGCGGSGGRLKCARMDLGDGNEFALTLTLSQGERGLSPLQNLPPSKGKGTD